MHRETGSMLQVLICFLVWSTLGSALQETPKGAIVHTKFGPVLGNDFGSYRNWQGVPFASPPLGRLRWKNPVDPSPWTTVKDCRNFTIGCAQKAHSLDVPKNTSEDCLYLEVWAPPLNKYAGQTAAVMVFFYGGAFKEGGESFAIYNGKHMAQTQNVVTVVTNYRIGEMGFLYTGHMDANVGLEDQRFTLRWVQLNIAAFGGDRDKVTIFGQSAGGQSVLIHMSAPNSPAASMFHRAIVESGPALIYKQVPAALLLAEAFSRKLGCRLADVTCMQDKSTSEVLEAGRAVIIPLSVGSAIERWSPVVTGDASMPTEPLYAFEKGEIVNVPFMIGSNKDDGMMFGWALAPWNKTSHTNEALPVYEYEAIVAGIFPNEHLFQVLKMYPPDHETHDCRSILSLLITDFLFACYARSSLVLAEKAGLRQTYLYQYSYHPPFCPWPKSQQFCCEGNAVCHGDEMAYVFQDTGPPFPWTMPAVPDLALSNMMARFWASFAHFGDPNHFNENSTLQWPVFRHDTDQSVELNWPIRIVAHLKKNSCDFFDKVGYYN